MGTNWNTGASQNTFSLCTVMEHRHRMLRDPADPPSLEIFKSILDMVLGNHLQRYLPTSTLPWFCEFFLVIFPNSEFNSSWLFPSAFNGTWRISKSWMIKIVALEMGWVGGKKTEAQETWNLTIGIIWLNFKLTDLIIVFFGFSRRLQ